MFTYGRRVLFCDFQIFDTVRKFKDKKGKPAKIPSVLDIEGFYSVVESMYESGKALLVANGKRAQFHIQDLDEDDAAYYFLVNMTTADGNHHTSRDIETGARDEHRYKDTEGPERSIHVIIVKPSEADACPLVLVEKVSGASLSKVIQFFNSILRTCVRDRPDGFTFEHPLKETDSKGNVKLVKHVPKVSFNGHISETLFNDIDNGSVSGLELISDGPEIAGMDNEIPENFESWRVKLDKSPMADGSKQYIQQLMRQGKSFNMDRLKVSFRDASDTSHTKEFSIDDSPLDDRDAYVLSKGFKLDFRPMDSYTELHRKICNEMWRLRS